ncbi:hypothetical protein ANO14919_125620 [Xylariales sp. No.14919]|nr:hypothetical protein ANO14919_125620 [Xylariales sp. No.14919]
MDSTTSSSGSLPNHPKEAKEPQHSAHTEASLGAQPQLTDERGSWIQQATPVKGVLATASSELSEGEVEFLDTYRSLLTSIYPEGIFHSTVEEVHDYILQKGGPSSPLKLDQPKNLSILLQAYLRFTTGRFFGSEGLTPEDNHIIEDCRIKLMLIEQKKRHRLMIEREIAQMDQGT